MNWILENSSYYVISLYYTWSDVNVLSVVEGIRKLIHFGVGALVMVVQEVSESRHAEFDLTGGRVGSIDILWST
jgi:hypothetical protein